METKHRSEKGVVPQTSGRSAGRSGHEHHQREKLATVLLVAIFVLLVAVSTFFKLFGWEQRSPYLTAAIADELDITDPNPTFVRAATSMLEGAGYGVDYYPGENVTVEFYRKLPTHGYDLIILRVHAARLRDEQGTLTDDAGLFTSDPYSKTKYVEEQRADRLRPARFYFDPANPGNFGITPDFVKSSMKGKFQDSTIIIMGCDGLRSNTLAEAFVQRGATTVVSWNGLVSRHTDAATELLLQHLLVDRLSIERAVAGTMAELGPDPAYGSTLLFYPRQAIASGPGGAYPAP